MKIRQKKIPISGNVALYAFLRVAAADNASNKADQARSRTLLSRIGLTEVDHLKLVKIFTQYATELRAIRSHSLSRASHVELLQIQRSEIILYANVIHRIRAELTSSGIEKLREYLERKKNKISIRTGAEGAAR